MSEVSKEKVFSNFFWRFLERFGAKGVEFIVSIVLARILAPDVYAMIALVTVFIAILNVFIDSGFGNALIQKKNADDLDFSSVFYFNITICLVLYFGMFILSPVIANFYDMPELEPVIKVLSLTLVISGVKNVQQAYVSRNLMFKKFFFATSGGTIVAAVVGITMAYKGFGVWALVAQQLVNATIDTIILWIIVDWRPKAMFSFERLKGLLSFGWKLLASSLLDTFYNEIQSLIIGKFYSKNDLAFFNQGKKYPYLLAVNINASIDSVLLPVMAKKQDEPSVVKIITRRSIKTGIFILAPIMIGMCACANELICLVLTEKWMPAKPYFVVFCISFITFPIHTANLAALKAIGRSDKFLKLEVIKKIFAGTVLLISVWFGPFVMACSNIFTSFVSIFINSAPNRKLLDYSVKEQLLDIIPNIILSAVMGLLVWFIGNILTFSMAIVLLIKIVLGIAIYISGSLITKNDSFTYLYSILLSFVKNNRKKV